MAEKYLSVLMGRFLDPYIRSEYSKFAEFIKTYLEYLESEGNIYFVVSDFFHYLDIDKLDQADPYGVGDAEVLEEYVNKYLTGFPLHRIQDIDIKTLIKKSRDFYASVGTQKSFDFLFRLMNHAGVFSFYYPYKDILITSRKEEGKTSSAKKLHDNRYRAFWTYEIRSTLFGYAELKEIVTTLLHPTGCKAFFMRIIESTGEYDPEILEVDSGFQSLLVEEALKSWLHNTSYIQYKASDLTFQDLENDPSGLLGMMDFNDWGDTWNSLEISTTEREDFYQHQPSTQITSL